MKVYADNGINWEFLFEVVYEDDYILILRDMGRFHKFDSSRMYKGVIDKYIELFDTSVLIDGVRKLYEIK